MRIGCTANKCMNTILRSVIFPKTARIKVRKYDQRALQFSTRSNVLQSDARSDVQSDAGEAADKRLGEILCIVQKILKENNFYAFMKNNGRIKNDEGKMPLSRGGKDVDIFHLLNVLNKIVLLIKEEDDDFKIRTWKNSLFHDLLTYIKLQIPFFTSHEMFLFVLCFSKMQFMPQVLLEEVLLTIKEEDYLRVFFHDDTTKFYQFLLLLSNIQNVRSARSARSVRSVDDSDCGVADTISHPNFVTFMKNYIQVLLDNFNRGEVSPAEEPNGEVGETVERTGEPNSGDKERRHANLDCYMMLCSGLHNLNLRNDVLLHRVSNEVLYLAEESHSQGEMDIDVTKKLINIYLSYASLGFSNYYFYDKLNEYLYNVIELVPISSCLTLLLSISTLREQPDFKFPLCLLSVLEKIFTNNFYSLDAKDLLLLTYLFTYMRLYISKCDMYMCMLDTLFNFHHFSATDESDKVMLFQIYTSLTQGGFKYDSKSGSQQQQESHMEQQPPTQLQRTLSLSPISPPRCAIAREIVEKLKNSGILRRMENNFEGTIDENISRLDKEIEEQVEDVLSILRSDLKDMPLKIRNLQKNVILHGYYLSHVCFDVERGEYQEATLPRQKYGEQKNASNEEPRQMPEEWFPPRTCKVILHFDTTMGEEWNGPPLDIYTNMKRQHIESLKIKYVLIKLNDWKKLSQQEKKKFLICELEDKK
ncbi:conserved Plasmodium protein, unknown function [Plasmodium ovale wallikeri]|uniref:Uncharacterized protein n=2 Tax=Plasmodium ovale TaxID=36330 RepID=A0A1A8Z5D7_PLAOA|nr:conserved Plasmodium protein, unknown function [Plasmodium ovale wallikeri]SBT39019.1 conserved Plasmodium protein, unknown function [Plasmodium ovale wallikeri]SBT77742.1 conserved Plasmodium protein, unknown function [Plasmodium ovale]